jgi:hypothetical protein
MPAAPALEIAPAPPTANPSAASGTAPAASTAPSQTAGQDGPVNAAQNPPSTNSDKPADKPAENLADRTPAAAIPAAKPASGPRGAVGQSKIAPRSAPAAAPKRHATVRHRPLIARRIVRPRAVAPAQTFTAIQPAYQWAAPGQSVQPVRRRAIVRRTRPARTPVAAPQAAIPTATAVNAPE